MIKEGCLDGVDEVYGLHNAPGHDEGIIRVKEGILNSSITIIKIRVIGQGGHGSMPHNVKDPITTAAYILNNLHTI